MEMVVQGVSTRKVRHITEELCGVSFFKSTVSGLCHNLENRVKVFNERRLDGNYPFVVIDAMFIKSRIGDRVLSRAVLIATGIREDGYREILGLKMGDSESYATWEEMFRWLKSRGLSGVCYVISDQHAGLVEAVKKQFQGASWQRCQVHLMCNIMQKTSRRWRRDVIARVKEILQASNIKEARRLLDDYLWCEMKVT